MLIKLKDFSNSITNEQVGSRIYEEIKKGLASEEMIEIDFSGIIVMTTFCANQIFGRLYSEIGQSEFGKKMYFHNVSDDLKVVVNHGISQGAK